MRARPGSLWRLLHGLFLIADIADAAYTLRQSYDAQSQNFFTGFNFRDVSCSGANPTTRRKGMALIDTPAQNAYFGSLGLADGRSEPSGGFVNYVSYEEALELGLVAYINDKVFIGADSLGVVNVGTGRNSVRLESKRSFDEGLLIADIARMPGNACGMWPALYDPPSAEVR